MNLDSGTQIQTLFCCVCENYTLWPTVLEFSDIISRLTNQVQILTMQSFTSFFFLFFLFFFIFVLIKLINYKKNVVNFLQMQTNEPYPIEMDLKRGVLYFFHWISSVFLATKSRSYARSFLKSCLRHQQINVKSAFCRQSSPLGIPAIRAKSPISSIILGILILKLLLPSYSCYYVSIF